MHGEEEKPVESVEIEDETKKAVGFSGWSGSQGSTRSMNEVAHDFADV